MHWMSLWEGVVSEQTSTQDSLNSIVARLFSLSLEDVHNERIFETWWSASPAAPRPDSCSCLPVVHLLLLPSRMLSVSGLWHSRHWMGGSFRYFFTDSMSSVVIATSETDECQDSLSADWNGQNYEWWWTLRPR